MRQETFASSTLLTSRLNVGLILRRLIN